MVKRNVIIDCDPGVDDAFALILALKCEELNIIGITTLGGNLEVINAAKNALKVLKLMNRMDIPVYIGAEGPLKRKLVTAKEVHGEDGLGNTFLDDADEGVLRQGAVDFILDTIKEYEDVSIVALGPLTNLAKVIEKDKKTFNRVKEIVSMGGAFRVPGNCSPVGEFNYWADPHAAKYVFENITMPFTMVGLDVTSQVVLTPNYIELLRHFENPVADFMVNSSKFYSDFYWKENKILGCIINDALALAYFVDNSLCEGFSYYVEVVEDGVAMGQSIVDEGDFYKRRSNCKVLTKAFPEKFLKLYFDRVFPEFKSYYEKFL